MFRRFMNISPLFVTNNHRITNLYKNKKNYYHKINGSFNGTNYRISVLVKNEKIHDIIVFSNTKNFNFEKNVREIFIGITLFDLFSMINTNYDKDISNVMSLLKSVLLDY